MERVLYLWDELDDAIATARHVLRSAWQECLAAAPLKFPR
jgi:hypothetical protein